MLGNSILCESIELMKFNAEEAEFHYSSIKNFEPIKHQTHCSYSAGSKIWGAPSIDPALSFRNNMQAVAQHLAHFICLYRTHQVDGYVVELPDKKYGLSLEALAKTTHATLKYLSAFDPMGDDCMARPIEDLSWCFAFGGEKIFVNTFAPCYPANHPRYGFGATGTFIMMQPRHTFSRLIRSGDSALAPNIRTRIRETYANHGRGYNGKLSMTPYEAYRCVRPMQADGAPVRWWESCIEEF